MYIGIQLFFWASLMWCVLSFYGLLHPALDSLAVFREAAAVALLLCVIVLAFTGGWWRVVLGVLVLGLAANAMYRPFQSNSVNSSKIGLYQKNMWFYAEDVARVHQDILATGADIITLEEVRYKNKDILPLLAKTHPYSVVCNWPKNERIVLLSRWPITQNQNCINEYGFLHAEVNTPEGPISFGVIHHPWPWPVSLTIPRNGRVVSQIENAKVILAEIKKIKGPFVLAGDFNHVHWSNLVKRYERAAKGRRVGPIMRSFALKQIYPIPLDHVIVPKGWGAHAERRAKLSSDHAGIFVQIEPR